MQRYPFVVVYNDAKWNLEKRFSDFAELDAALDEAQKNGDFGDAQVTCSILVRFPYFEDCNLHAECPCTSTILSTTHLRSSLLDILMCSGV